MTNGKVTTAWIDEAKLVNGKVTGEAQLFTIAPPQATPFYVCFQGGAKLTLNPDGSATFEGDADDAARQFFDNIIMLHAQYRKPDDLLAARLRIAELETAIRTHSESTHFCEVCGKDDPCTTDDVCSVLHEPCVVCGVVSERPNGEHYCRGHK